MKFTDLQTKTIYAERASYLSQRDALVVLDASTMYQVTTSRYGTGTTTVTPAASRRYKYESYNGRTTGVLALRGSSAHLRAVLSHARFDDFVARVSGGEPFVRHEVIDEFFGDGFAEVSLKVSNPRDIEGEFEAVVDEREAELVARHAQRESERAAARALGRRVSKAGIRLRDLVPGASDVVSDGGTHVQLRLDDLEALLTKAQG